MGACPRRSERARAMPGGGAPVEFAAVRAAWLRAVQEESGILRIGN